ncbi:PDZ domain-containing protein [Streptomyces lusitanus]|uniref:PDZ domain-containing protein n=1 Tax=Streptomyces lusitanus TaxID=68232 RepID=A0ABU3K0W8_9ACTN|nr:PDZ domain-containing protein [Streptomyces lusitanus]
MEQPVLRPRPMPGARAGARPGPGPVPPAAEPPPPGRSRGRRAAAVLIGAAAGLVLLLAGAGLGVLGAALTGPTWPPGTAPASAPALSARLGVVVTDDSRPGALVVGVQVPGPGFAAGLREGDLLLSCGPARVDTAADLARALARTPPGTEIRLTVRHPSGGYRQLTAVPGILT